MSERIKSNMTATALSIGSALVQNFPGLNRRIGGSDFPNYRAVRWRNGHRGANEIGREWLTYDKDEMAKSGLPADWEKGAVISVDKRSLEAAKIMYRGGYQAVAYKLGSTIMVGADRHRADFFVDDPEELNRVGIGMRIGDGTPVLGIGIVIERDGTFMSLADEKSAGPVQELKALPAFV